MLLKLDGSLGSHADFTLLGLWPSYLSPEDEEYIFDGVKHLFKHLISKQCKENMQIAKFCLFVIVFHTSKTNFADTFLSVLLAEIFVKMKC